MAAVNTQPILFTASGLLSAQSGPNNVAFPKNPNGAPKRWRIQGIKVVKMGAGSVEIFDSATASPAPKDSVYYNFDASETVTNLGINCTSGDIYVNMPTVGSSKVYLYIDLNN